MASFPSSPMLDPIPSAGTGIQRFEDWLTATKQLIGAAGVERPAENPAVRISSGSITPTRGTVEIDTEASAATDDLTNINQTHLPDGSLLLLKIADNGRKVVVKHNAGGTGLIELSGGLDFELNRVEQRLLLQREGTKWVEVLRAGREKEHLVGAAGEPAFAGSWTAPLGIGVRFWKDENGIVHLSGAARHSASPTDDSAIFTLPAGYRPLNVGAHLFPVYVVDNGVRKIALAVVDTTGVVSLAMAPAGNPTGPTVLVFFFGVHFRAEA